MIIQNGVNVGILLVENTKISDYNLYVYCSNNPINYSDVDGDNPLIAHGAILSDDSLVGALLEGLSVCLCRQKE